jgi:hypothetical protein
MYSGPVFMSRRPALAHATARVEFAIKYSAFPLGYGYTAFSKFNVECLNRFWRRPPELGGDEPGGRRAPGPGNRPRPGLDSQPKHEVAAILKFAVCS